MKKIIVIILVFLSVSISLYAISGEGHIEVKMSKDDFAIMFFSKESIHYWVGFGVVSDSTLSEYKPALILGPGFVNDEMMSEEGVYRCTELFSDNDLYLIYRGKRFWNDIMEVNLYYTFSTSYLFNQEDISFSEKLKRNNDATKDIIRGILKAHKLMFHIHKFDFEAKEFRSVGIISMPLNANECFEAHKKLEAFEIFNQTKKKKDTQE